MYTTYVELMRKIADINNASALLQWDQETYMPVNGAALRAQQISTLAGISHQLSTSTELENVLNTLMNDATQSGIQKVNIEESLYQFNQNKKYSTDFVIELNKTISEAFHAWQDARKKNDFKIFSPLLKKLVVLKRRECEMLGYSEHAYDALLNLFERGMTTKITDKLFEDVRAELVPFVKKVLQHDKADTNFFTQYFDKQKQWDFGIDLLKQMNYNFDSGRQDISAHPFTTSFNSNDVRITTRINQNDLREMIWSCIHEGGHALYEQGLNANDYGLPSGEFISLGIHESQSRLWENHVGRSLPYWKKNYSLLQNYFPAQLNNITVEEFYKAVNVVEPLFIRTSADELTYHFHVMIRFEIEKQLIEGTIEVDDLPAIWNEKYKTYLDIDVPNDSQGVLQDVHWSHGSFGYFPTYSLGSFYAAQFFAKAQNEISNLDELIEQGELKPLLNWLREKIHKHGRIYNSNQLCKIVTGEELSFKYFMNYAYKKFGKN